MAARWRKGFECVCTAGAAFMGHFYDVSHMGIANESLEESHQRRSKEKCSLVILQALEIATIFLIKPQGSDFLARADDRRNLSPESNGAMEYTGGNSYP